MAYNKTKHLDSAQKYLHQGKIAQAIGEYQHILKHESKDQVTLMTIGDLYVRQGETFQALEYFERLAQIFLSDGFVTKAIAIYKKIAKLAPEEPRPVERLAELYVQQGVLSEARPIYLQLAELHQRAGRQPQAAAMLQKLLEAEPDNLRVQTRLAELYLAMRKPDEAAAAFRGAAQLLQGRGDHAEAIEQADQALKIDVRDAAAQTLKARSLAASGKPAEALTLLEALPEIDAGGEPAELLLDFCLASGDFERASKVASKLFARSSKQFAHGHKVADALLEAGEPSQALPMLDLVREAMTNAGEHEHLGQSLVRAAERLPGRIEPREWLVELYRGTSDSFRLPNALADLADAYQNAKRNDDAKRVMEELLQRDPDNDQAHRHYDQLLARMGLSGAPSHRGSEEPPLTEPAPPTPPKFTEPPLDDETQRFVSQALTDVDLFSTYGLAQKATDILENVLRRVPGYAPALERLLDVSLGAGDEHRTAELAQQLEQLHSERGDTASADRFAELRRRFERAAAVAPSVAEPAAPLEFSVPPAEAAPLPESSPEPEPASVPMPEPGAAEPQDLTSEPDVHEVDLSEEWAALSMELSEVKQRNAAEPEPALEPAEPEVAEAPAAVEPLEFALPPEFAAVIDSADLAPVAQNNGNGHSREAVPDAVEEPPAAPEFVLELDSTPIGLQADDLLRELSAELDGVLPSIGGSETSTPVNVAEAPYEEPVGVSVASSPANGADATPDPLSDLFNEFRADLGEGIAENEDLETHYNLGVAYREMGLLDEAISEFQRVAKARERGKAFRYAMQCCTLLGLAFIEKGQPGIAAMWYERALESPGLDQESVLALRYDLGMAQELAGDTNAARKSFSQVYGMNIDYRDVADRLAALGKGR